MHTHPANPTWRSLSTGLLGAVLLGLAACGGGGGGGTSAPPPPPPTYQVTSLVSDQATAGATTDTHLVNPWGLAYGPTTRFWVANQGTATATVYDGLGQPLATPLVVSDPLAAGRVVGGPTGMVFNASTGFQGDIFIMASLDGCISGWSAGTTVTRRVDHSASGAIYTGLAQGTSASATYLYAANLAGGTIDVFDAAYAPVTLAAGALVDPTLPAGYSPYNVQVLGGKLYVTYAQYTAGNPRETTGAGLGIVSVFNLDGTFVQRFATGGSLNAPWGLALAPASFGPFGGALLVGNFGDGRITAYNATTGALMGQLMGPTGTPLTISGLWGLAFGNDTSAGKSTQLYIAAGPQGQTHGLFATISYGATGTGGGTGGGPYGY
ncbi:TIGR03118 family protein [Geothrix mesophila]|uniref:TIGR03118 family protein n=1 Tax=Geothrix mesophila TaxID=2922723 RepID=UPI001FAC82A3|nr:TIGR03118 family protein [Geothrix sp. SG198]